MRELCVAWGERGCWNWRLGELRGKGFAEGEHFADVRRDPGLCGRVLGDEWHQLEQRRLDGRTRVRVHVCACVCVSVSEFL